ncbi:hypothetical protein V8F20_000240 [Naviculisporaceae sp. PSN 640]
MSDFETAHQLEQAKASHQGIPAELSFEDVIKNRTCPPCSLNDFMDYLYYIEHNAESLQFFLWYCDYVERFSGLLPRQKALSKPWDPEKAKEPRSRFITYSHKRARSDKMGKIMTILEMESDKKARESFEGEHKTRGSISTTASRDSSRPRTPPPALLSPTGSTAKEDWQPFTIQPFRDEISRIVRQYIAEGAPRQLSLSAKDREWCLRASQHTTHPSALLPAFTVAEANLRSQHPNFIRWTRSNTNPTRMVFARAMGILLILIGFAIDIILILSRRSNFLRIVCLVPWWPGITSFIAGWKCLCVILHFKNERQLRPWEQETHYIHQDEDEDEEVEQDKPKDKGDTPGTKQHPRQNHSISSTTSSRPIDPLRKESLQTFGPKNDYTMEKEEWFSSYKQKGIMDKIFDETIPVQNRALRMLQDRTVFFAVLCGGVGASVLTVGSLFIPGRNLIL